MVAEFAKAASLLLSLCLLYAFIAQRWPNQELTGKALSGLLFGAICVIGMEAPVTIAPGVIFDPRSVIISLSGVFGGPICGVIAALIAGGYRAYLGGGGAPVGVAVVVACVGLGIAFRAGYKAGRFPLNWLTLLAFGLVVHIVVIGIFTQLPAPVAEKVMKTVALPFVIAFTPAAMVLGMILAYIDDRIDTRKALAASEARLQSIIDNGPNAMTLKDGQGKILLANPTYAAWVGSSPASLVGKTMWDVFPESDARAITEKDKSVLASGDISIGEVSRTFPAAGLKHLRNHKIPILIGAGNERALITIMVDITEEKAVQQELRNALALAEDANLAKTQFLATMSHELRTPLNAIIGFSEILYRQYFGPPGAGKYTEYAKDIHSSAAYLLSLVEDLLDISAIEAGSGLHDLTEVSIFEIAKECADAARDRAYEKDIDIDITVPDGLPPVMADDRAVKQVFLNLLVNAIKFTPSSGRITVSASVSDGMAAVTVADTGPGIDADLIDRLLEPFATRNQNPFTTEKGWGLGLSITKSLVEQLGGAIRIDSAPGNGTRVTFTLPLAFRSEAAAEAV
ncbi:MAG: ATP-binding protein [Rhodospirillales bacterium]